MDLAERSQVTPLAGLQKILRERRADKYFISRGQFLKSLSDLEHLRTVSGYCLGQAVLE